MRTFKGLFPCTLILVSLLAIMFHALPVEADPPILLYVQPPSITEYGPYIGRNYTFEIRVQDVTFLYTWAIGLKWNPAVLECTDFTEGPFLKTGGSTVFVPGTIDNTAGNFTTPYGCSLTWPNVKGVNGSGTLALVNFTVKSYGQSWINFTADTALMTYYYVTIPATRQPGWYSLTADTTPPTVVILSPQNITYATSSVPLTFTANDDLAISWMGYSLDGHAPVTLIGNTTLTGLSDGSHNVVVYANDTSGNPGSSQVYFTIATPPTIVILSPQNKTYAGTSVPLTFTVDEPTSWMGYSLDGQPNVTITGNTTLTDLIGYEWKKSHNVIVYATDTHGNPGSSNRVYFTVVWPVGGIVVPVNKLDLLAPQILYVLSIMVAISSAAMLKRYRSRH